MKFTTKKLMTLILAGIMAISLTGCGGEEKKEAAGGAKSGSGEFANLKQQELILADSAAKGAAGELFDAAFAKNLEKITGGKLKVDFHPNGDLGNDVDLIRQMKNGDIDMVGSQIAPLVSFIPEMAVFDLPMVFAKYDGDTIDKVLNGDSKTHKALVEGYHKADLELLGIEQNATYRLTTSNRPLNKLEDFKGLLIRTMENKNHMAFWTAIGASPTPLTWGEVYISLQNGTIEAEENAADTVANSNFHEVQKYLADTNHILYANQLSMNKKKYDSLDPAYKKAIAQAVQAALKEMRPQMAKIDKDNKANLKKKGMNLISYDDKFFNTILNLDTVKALYKDIDNQVKGLGTTMQKELEANKKK